MNFIFVANLKCLSAYRQKLAAARQPSVSLREIIQNSKNSCKSKRDIKYGNLFLKDLFKASKQVYT